MLRNVALLDVPAHVACLMDGNRRWANQRGLPRTAGYAAAEPAVISVIDGAVSAGINWLTLYTFSTENWKRPAVECSFLMQLAADMIARHTRPFHLRNIRMRAIGRLDEHVSTDERVPRKVVSRIRAAERLTHNNTGLTVTFAFNYGGRAEIVDAAAALAHSHAAITELSLSTAMYASDIPDPDLVLRFGGERRLSNFMLWQLAYAELDFLDVLWPDARDHHILASIARYRKRSRRFGGA